MLDFSQQIINKEKKLFSCKEIIFIFPTRKISKKFLVIQSHTGFHRLRAIHSCNLN